MEARIGDSVQRLELMGGRSYLSQTESILTFGLGAAVQVDELTIVWPDGKTQKLRDVPADQLLHINKRATRQL